MFESCCGKLDTLMVLICATDQCLSLVEISVLNVILVLDKLVICFQILQSTVDLAYSHTPVLSVQLSPISQIFHLPLSLRWQLHAAAHLPDQQIHPQRERRKQRQRYSQGERL